MLPMPAPSCRGGVLSRPPVVLPRLRSRTRRGRRPRRPALFSLGKESSALPSAGHFWPQRPAAQTLSVPPAAPFLSAAKEMGERTPPKTNGFWNSFRPITATPQKVPRRIAPAPIPAAASTCRGEMPYPIAVEQCTSAWYVGAAAIRGLHAIRCTTMFGNLSRAWYAAGFSVPQPRRKS